ncbi:uncharacterized protein LOC110735415 isoform X1 [Chenopodium quinoa]|uniref:uncharacterized protein LOC110735415 isoform X1 n=1 Tax=Chenopodium quinoa TaxID=63459 RepID=UPI000B790209|nr:uncharacterized protein LOC110735415 isoform X1 [Chenopodium quinoa]XP_021771299.1 uncharacterized protein LOC110735415 isoform X1 [Chenopodium quinoa]
MGRSKTPSKKPQPRGVDFKKFKKKLGRKLPPAHNVTNTEIKTKAIILPEQSVALDKEGVAVSKKGLTLKELLQQTSHHNVKVRRDALVGIKDLLLKFPAEVKLHKNAVIEKLRERISDDDKVVRETLFQLFKSIILPGCKEDIKGAPISLIMAYIFKAMTNLAIDVRFMAFKFFDLVVQTHPPAFSTYAEKALENYTDLLQKNQFFSEEKSKLKFALSSLVRCLSLLPSNGKEIHSSGQTNAEKEVLHAFERDMPNDSTGHILIVGKLKDLVPVLVNCFYGLMSEAYSQPQLDSHSFDCMQSTLHSIDLIVRYKVYGISKYQQDVHTSMSSNPSTEIHAQDEKFPLLLLDKLFAVFPMQPTRAVSEEDDHYDRRYYILNAVISRIFFTFNQYISPLPVLCERFLSFLKDWLFELYRSNVSDKAFYDKQLPSLVPFIPYLVSTVDDQDHHLLKAFTTAFGNCSPESSLKMACLEAVEEMLVLKQEILFSDAADKEILDCQKTWIHEIGLLLNSISNKRPSSFRAVLHLLLRLGQIGLSNSDLAVEYDKLQDELQKYYCIKSENGHISYGPFMELSKESQELSICCLYYFSCLKGQLLASLALCCLSHSLEPSVLFRIIEVLHSSYNAGHIHVVDYISFLVTLLSQYEISEKTCSTILKEANLATFRSVTGRVCCFLSQMGDPSLLFQILEDVVLDHISQKLPIHNTCALMGMLITVDSRPTRLSEKSIIKLGDIMLSYMIDVALLFPVPEEEQKASSNFYAWHDYLLPCFFLLDRSSTFCKLLLDRMVSLVGESGELPFLRDTQLTRDHPRKIRALVSIFIMMSMDSKMRTVLFTCQTEIDNIFQSILLLQQSSMMSSMNIEQQHQVQSSVERLKKKISEMFSMTS